MTTTPVVLLPEASPPAGFLDWLKARAWGALHRVLSIREIGFLTLVALVGYILAGFWMRYDMHFYINDALNRTTDALFVTDGRDPHMGGIGFYWPPLPQMLQMPLVPLLEPHGMTIMAGPASTALCMAATIPVIGAVGRFLNLGRWTTFAFCLVFAINPITIYYSTNGMSEACFFFTGSLSILGFLRYIRSRSVGDMTLFGMGLAGAVLTRLEGPAFALILGLIASFDWRALRSVKVVGQVLWNTFLIGLPALVAFGTWMAVQAVLMHNPLYFLAIGTGNASLNAPWLPPHSREPWASFLWAGNYVLVLGATLILAALYIVWSPTSEKVRGCVGLIAAMGIFLAIQIYSVGIVGGGYGDPRYFVMAVPFATIAAMWLAGASPTASAQRRTFAPLYALPLIGILLVNGASGNWYLSSGRVTAIEHECTFFQDGVAKLLPSLGRGDNSHNQNYCGPFGNALLAFQNGTKYLDSILKPSDRVLTDNKTNFEEDLFTRHPGQFIVENDRDWHKITSNPYGTVTYIMTLASDRKALPETSSYDVGGQIVNANPNLWKLLGSWCESPGGKGTWVQLYKVVPGANPSLIP